MAYQVLDLFENKFLPDLNFWGTCSMEQLIRWVHVAELSNDMDSLKSSLKSNDLLIIMGPFLKGDAEQLLSIAEVCVDTGCSALMLYPEAVQRGIPSSVLTYAEVHQLPILEIRGEPPAISDLTASIAREITENDFMSPSVAAQNLILDLVRGNWGNQEMFRAIAKKFGFDLWVPLQAMLIEAEPNSSADITSYSASLKQYRLTVTHELPLRVDRVLDQYYSQKCLAAVINGNSYVLFLPESRNGSVKAIGQRILDVCSPLEAKGNCVLRIAIGTLGTSLDDYYHSIQEARQLLAVMKLRNMAHCVKHVDDLILSLIVREYRDAPLFRRLYENTITPLLELDRAEKYNLMGSLETFFACDKNISLSADMLYFHRNTMKSRLEKIESVTGHSFSNAQDCLELQMALYYYKLNKNDI